MNDLLEYELRTRLSHLQQVKHFGWCICEDTNGEGQLTDDCPQIGETNA